MQLKTERHAQEILNVEVPAGLCRTRDYFENVIRGCVSDWDRVILKDGITVDSDTLYEYVAQQQDDPDPALKRKMREFLEAVIAIEPIPDRYFFHL